VEQIDFVLKQVDLELSGLSFLSSCDSLNLQHLKNVDQDLSSPETPEGAVERFIGLKSYPGDFYLQMRISQKPLGSEDSRHLLPD
jgi:hypothetical protein